MLQKEVDMAKLGGGVAVIRVGAATETEMKVTNSALVNASSVAATLLTTEAAVAQIKEAAPAAQPNPEMDY